MKYKLYDRPPLGVSLLTALQWIIVTLSSTIVVPIVIGDVYGLGTEQVGLFMQQTIFYVGLASLFQVLWGHQYPMMDGPAGLWWGIYLILAQIGISLGQDPIAIGQSFELGLIIAGVIFIILGATKWIGRIQKWFTPITTGIYMTLLAISLCSTFVKGLLGVGYHHSTKVLPAVALASLVIIVLVLVFMRIPKLSSYAVLLGMAVGWAGFAVMGWADPVKPTDHIVVWPSILFWGPPKWDGGIVLTSILTGFVLLTNLITSMVVVGRVVQQEPTQGQLNRGGIMTGVPHLISGISGVVGMIPISLAAAVIETTKIASRRPFIFSMIAFMVIGILPPISQLLASIPTPVAYAAMFVTYTQLLGFGLKDFAKVNLDQRTITIIGSALLVGIGVMFVPVDAWKSLNPLLSYLLGNGLLLGVLLALLLEHVVFKEKKTSEEKKALRN
ncbi:purine/pyrimidine permease [Brevibacillus ginsengisoli]|uniref:purine/pyrimidine permease n=1 Tax=Brevibacillus ginsengisoli TaxID=363854 RepID=UPI003CF00C8A